MTDLLTKLAALCTSMAMRHMKDDESAREAVVRRYPEPGDADSVDTAARITALEGALRGVLFVAKKYNACGCTEKECPTVSALRRAKQVLGDK